MPEQTLTLVVFVPTTHADAVRQAMAEAGAGKIGNYSHCSFSSMGTGRFMPEPGSNPAVGKVGELSVVPEERIEIHCLTSQVKDITAAIKKINFYEEIVIDVYPLSNIAD